MNAGIIEALFRLKDEVTPTLRQIQKTVKEVRATLDRDLGASVVQKLGDGLNANVGLKLAAGITAGAAAFGAGIAYMAKSTLDLADQVSNLSAQTGVGVESLQRLALAGNPVGVSMEDAAKGVVKLQRNLVEGSAGVTEALGKLGLSRNVLAEMLPEQQLEMVITALGEKVPDAATRSALAIELLGKSGTVLVPLAAELRKLQDVRGLVISDQDIANADALGDSIGSLVQMFMLLVRNIGAVITSNASLHRLVAGIAGVFVLLTGQVRANRDSMQSLVSDGVALVTRALVLFGDVAALANDTWTALVLTWRGAQYVAASLAEVLLQVARATSFVSQPGNMEIRKQLAEQIDAVRLFKLELSDAANDDVAANTKRAEALDQVRAALAKLDKEVRVAAGREVKEGLPALPKVGSVLEPTQAARQAFESLMKTVATGTAQAQQAIASLATSSMTTLGAAWANIDADLQGKLTSLQQAAQEAIAKGVDPGQAQAAIQPLIDLYGRLAEAQRQAAFEGARKSLLGETFGDAAQQAASLLEITQKFGARINSLTTSDLNALVAKLVDAREALRAVGDDEGMAQVQDEIERAAAAVIERAKQENDYVQVGNGLWMRRSELVRQAAEADAEAKKKAADALEEQLAGLEELRSIFSDLIGIFDAFGLGFLADVAGSLDAGVAAAERFLATTDKTQKALAGLQAAGAAFSSGSFLGGAATGAAFGNSIAPGGIGAVIGGLAGGILGLFGKAKRLREEMRKLRESFIDSMGGMDSLRQKAAAAGVSLNAMFQAKNAKQLEAAIAGIKSKLDLWDESHQKLQEAIDKYGFTIEELGPKFKQQALDEMAAGLIQDFRLLTASGIDQVLVLQKMGPAFNEYVQTAMRAGAALPETMRPMIEQLIQSGQLLDAQGNAFTSIEQAGISFTETLSEGLTRLIDKIDQLVSALTGAGSAARNVSIPTPGPGGKFSEPNVPGFGAGSGGFRDFGGGTLAMLHGVEAVVRPQDVVRVEPASSAPIEIAVTFGDILIPPGASLDPRLVAQALGTVLRDNLAGIADRIQLRQR